MATAIVLFDSRGGNTQAVAEALADGVRMVPKVDCTLASAEAMDLDALKSADAVAVGSPNYYSYMSGRIKTVFDLAFRDPAFKGKPFVAFSTHGGGGGISELIEKLGGSLGMKKVADGLDIMNAPAGDQVKE